MFKIFKRRKDKPALTYGVMYYVSEAVERRQRKIAGYLNSRTKGYSKRKWIWLLVAFCITMGSIATDILFNGMQHQKSKVQVQSISVPAFISKENKAMDSLQLLEEIYQHRRDSVFKKK